MFLLPVSNSSPCGSPHFDPILICPATYFFAVVLSYSYFHSDHSKYALASHFLSLVPLTLDSSMFILQGVKSYGLGNQI